MTSRWFAAALLVTLGVALTPSCSSSSSGNYVLCSEAGTCPDGLVCQDDVCVAAGAGGTGGSGTGGFGGTGGTVAGAAGTGGSGGGNPACMAGVDCTGCTACFDTCVCGGGPTDQCLTACSGTGGTGGGTGGSGGSTGGFGGTGGTGGGTGGFGGTGGSTGGTGGGTGGTGGTGGSTGGTGGSTGGTGGTAGYTCDQIFQPSVCATCIVGQCCTQAEGCFNTECGDFWNCYFDFCSAAADPDACVQTNCGSLLGGIPAFNALVDCMGTYCAVDCGADGG